MKILSLFTHPHVIPNLYDFLIGKRNAQIFTSRFSLNAISINEDWSKRMKKYQ